MGSRITRALGGRPNTLSTVDFEYGDGWKITIIQGHITTIAPRDERGLLFATPAMRVLFGDVPGSVFIVEGDVPTALGASDRATRYIRGSPGMDPAIIVAVAEGMRRVDPGDD